MGRKTKAQLKYEEELLLKENASNESDELNESEDKEEVTKIKVEKPKKQTSDRAINQLKFARQERANKSKERDLELSAITKKIDMLMSLTGEKHIMKSDEKIKVEKEDSIKEQLKKEVLDEPVKVKYTDKEKLRFAIFGKY